MDNFLYDIRERRLNYGLAKHVERSAGHSTSTSGLSLRSYKLKQFLTKS